MSPDDPRHGTPAGYAAEIRARVGTCPDCREAKRRSNIMLALYPSSVPVIGTRRRIQALQALGWSRAEIARRMGYGGQGGELRAIMATSSTVNRATAAKVEAVYAELSMTRPTGQGAARARTRAARHGYAPPLAWDDIDDPNERPNYGTRADYRTCDPAVIERILSGEWKLPATKPEREEVCRSWVAQGRSLRELEAITGWKVERYYRLNDAS